MICSLILINPDVLLISVSQIWTHFHHIFTIIGGTISGTIRNILSPEFRGFAWDLRLTAHYPSTL